jgi:hypothetical protein
MNKNWTHSNTEDEKGGLPCVYDENNLLICEVHGEDNTEREQRARLFAYSNELVDALEAIYSTHKNAINTAEWCETEEEYFNEFPLFKKAHDVLKKVKGE